MATGEMDPLLQVVEIDLGGGGRGREVGEKGGRMGRGEEVLVFQ